MERKEKDVSELTQFCSIDGVQYFDADFTNAHYTVWNNLNTSEKEEAKAKFAKEIKISKLGDLIRVNGSRRCSHSQTHTDINGVDFSYIKKQFTKEPFQISLSENICTHPVSGNRISVQLSRVMACTFLEQGEGFLEVDHIKPRKNFQNKIEAEKLENLQWVDTETHKQKTSIDMSDTKSNKSINNARDKEVDDCIRLIIEFLAAQTYYSKTLTPTERLNKAQEKRRELTGIN